MLIKYKCVFANSDILFFTLNVFELEQKIQDQYLAKGLYYTITELGSLILEEGISELLGKSRITGIVIKQEVIFIIRYPKNRLIAYKSDEAAKAELAASNIPISIGGKTLHRLGKVGVLTEPMLSSKNKELFRIRTFSVQ